MSDQTAQTAHLGDLKPDPANARAHNPRNIGMVVDALHEVGAARSIVIDEDNVVLAGNGVTEAAAEAGIEKVRIIEADGNEIIAVRRRGLTPAQKKRLAYFDNRTAELASWDAAQIVADLQDDFDFDGLFADDELAAIVAGLDVGDGGPAPDPEDPDADDFGEVRPVRGDVWLVASKTLPGQFHRVMCGDSTDAGDVARLMDGRKADAVVTDPPYGVEYADKNKYLNAIAPGNRIQTPIEGDHVSKEEVQRLWHDAFSNMADGMHPGAAVYCFMPQGGDQMMMMMMMTGAGIEPRHELIWVKNNHVLGRADYNYKHEPILYAWKQGSHKFYGGFQTSVLEFDKPHKSDLHPTMKPVELIAHLLGNSSQRGDLVLDPFLGSGTTLIAAEQLGRLCYGMEITEKYVEVILRRCEAAGLAVRLEERAADMPVTREGGTG